MTKTTEEGPYRIEDAWSGSFKKGKVVGPSLSKEDIFPGTPETLCDMLNAAWLAGRSSVTAQVGEPVAWMASRSHDYRMDVISDAWKKDSPADGNMNKTFTIPLYAAPSTVPLSPEMVERIVQVVLKWVYKSGEIDYNLITSLLPEEKECGETKYVADLRTRLLGIR